MEPTATSVSAVVEATALPPERRRRLAGLSLASSTVLIKTAHARARPACVPRGGGGGGGFGGGSVERWECYSMGRRSLVIIANAVVAAAAAVVIVVAVI
ncbi:hypothetical protein DFJ73DRAFT_778520 [Zopfochytrium polystomum]|nr:hypothetical protein DFJ73DRAFT_778520 [Zopfochytrium polystomum]